MKCRAETKRRGFDPNWICSQYLKDDKYLYLGSDGFPQKKFSTSVLSIIDELLEYFISEPVKLRKYRKTLVHWSCMDTGFCFCSFSSIKYGIN